MDPVPAEGAKSEPNFFCNFFELIFVTQTVYVFFKISIFGFVNRPTAHSNTMLIHTFLKGNVEQIIQLLWMLGC